MANIFVAATATFNGKALARGKKEISAFDKQVGKLGKTFAGVFGAQQLLQFSKRAVQAFAADEKAAKSLEIQLRNTGFAFSAPAVENYIANLQKVTGVLDDQLRPAFQQLLTATGSITKSQDALNTALNVSAATGRSVTEVSAALTRGFSGNTTGLSRLGAGISKATLKTGDMDKILGELNKKFAGQAQARLTTYAGKMDLLTVSTENAKEEIGKGLLDAISLLGKNRSIEDAASQMDTFAKSISNAIYGVGLLISKLDGLASKITSGGLGELLIRLQPGGKGLQTLINLAGASRASNQPDNKQGRSSSRIYLQQLRLETKISKDLSNAKKTELATLKAKTEVEKLKDKFDIERIGLTLALNQATDEETKLRLRAQLAILDNNEALAKKINAEMDGAEKAKLLADALVKAGNAALYFKDWADYRAGERGDVAVMSNVPTVSAGGAMQLPSAASSFAMGAVQRGEYAPVTVNVAGSVLTEQDLTDTIQRTILQINKQGRGTTPAGGLSGGT